MMKEYLKKLMLSKATKKNISSSGTGPNITNAPNISSGMWISAAEEEVQEVQQCDEEFKQKMKEELKQEIVQEVFEEIFTQILGVSDIAEQKEMKERLGKIMERMGYK